MLSGFYENHGHSFAVNAPLGLLAGVFDDIHCDPSSTMSTHRAWFSGIGRGEQRSTGVGNVVSQPLPAATADAETAARLCETAEKLRHLRDNDGAIELYERALELNPQSIQGWVNLGIILREFWRPKAALECFERARGIPGRHPNVDVLLSQLIPICRDEAARATGNEEAELWLRRGWAAEEAGRLDSAIEYYELARFVNPRNARCLVMFGLALLSMDRGPDAMELFAEARSLNDPEANTWLANISQAEVVTPAAGPPRGSTGGLI